MTDSVDIVDVQIEIGGAEQVGKDLAAAFSPAQVAKAIQDAGYNCQERTADHIARASVTRHVTANRLGAVYTKYLEFAPGRTRSVGQGPQGGVIETKDATTRGVTIRIGNTEGLKRAYGQVVVAPTGGRKYLTIPLHADAYGRRVADFKAQGRKLRRLWGANGPLNVLVERLDETEEYQGKDGKTHKRHKLRPMYALVKSVTLPQDKGLLPTTEEYQDWASESLEATVALYRAMEKRRRSQGGS